MLAIGNITSAPTCAFKTGVELVEKWTSSISELVFLESARSRLAVPTANHIYIAVFLHFGKEKNVVPSRSSLQLN
jgi:hypothetical protein